MKINYLKIIGMIVSMFVFGLIIAFICGLTSIVNGLTILFTVMGFGAGVTKMEMSIVRKCPYCKNNIDVYVPDVTMTNDTAAFDCPIRKTRIIKIIKNIGGIKMSKDNKKKKGMELNWWQATLAGIIILVILMVISNFSYKKSFDTKMKNNSEEAHQLTVERGLIN